MKNIPMHSISEGKDIKKDAEIKRWQIYKILWPPVYDQRFTRAAALAGFGIALLHAIIFSLAAILGLAGSLFQIGNINFNFSHLLPAVIWVVISLGIYRMSRVAAIAGFVITLLGLIVDWPDRNVLNIVMIGIFITSIRGTFAYRNIMKKV